MSKLSNLSLKFERKLPDILRVTGKVAMILIWSGVALITLGTVVVLVIAAISSGDIRIALPLLALVLVVVGAILWFLVESVGSRIR